MGCLVSEGAWLFVGVLNAVKVIDHHSLNTNFTVILSHVYFISFTFIKFLLKI